WAERLLALALPEAWRESVLGDLHEEHAKRARHAPRRARLWYATEAARLALRFALRPRKKAELGAHARRTKGETMNRVLGDARFALRALNSRPGLAPLVVVTPAVGLAATAAISAPVSALLPRPLPFPALPRLVRLWESAPGADAYNQDNVAPANFHDWE